MQQKIVSTVLTTVLADAKITFGWMLPTLATEREALKAGERPGSITCRFCAGNGMTADGACGAATCQETQEALHIV